MQGLRSKHAINETITHLLVTTPLWSIALARILLAQLSFGFAWCLYLVYPKYLASELGVGPSGIGAVGAAAGVASAISATLVVRSIDRSRRALFVRGALILLLASIGYSFVERFGPVVYLLQACVAISYAFAFNAAMAAVTDVVAPARLGQAFGLQSSANLSMNAVSTLTAEAIARAYGWRYVFLTASVAALLSLSIGFGLPGMRRAPEEPAAAPPRYLSLLPVLATGSLVGSAYVAMAMFHQPYVLSKGAHQVSSFFVGFTAAALTMRLLFGHLGDRLGRGRVAIASLLIYALVTASMVRFNVALLWLHGAGFGIAHGIAYPTLIAFATERVAAGAKGRVIAAFSGFFAAGSAIGASGFGALSAAYGYPVIYQVATLGMLTGAVALAGFARRRAPEPST